MDSGIKKILVVRNDKLGDFMLTWPALSYLKKNLPQTEITCLIDKEFWPLAEHCPFIDKFIVDQNVFTLKNGEKMICQKAVTFNAMHADLQ